MNTDTTAAPPFAEEQKRVEECVATVRQARATLEQWEGRASAAHDELEQLQRRMGEEVLEAPERAEEFAREMQTLRDRISVAESAIAAQRPKVAPAERAYLLAEADLLEARDLVPAQAVLAEHNARTDELLALLEEHEGLFVPQSQLLHAHEAMGTTDVVHFSGTRSSALQAVVLNVTRQVQLIRELADGRDPRPLLTEWNFATHTVDYPTCVWGPDALVPARPYLDQVERARRDLEEIDQLIESLPAAIDELEEMWRANGSDPAQRVDRVAQTAHRREALEEQRAAALQRLSALS